MISQVLNEYPGSVRDKVCACIQSMRAEPFIKDSRMNQWQQYFDRNLAVLTEFERLLDSPIEEAQGASPETGPTDDDIQAVLAAHFHEPAWTQRAGKGSRRLACCWSGCLDGAGYPASHLATCRFGAVG